MSNWLNAKINCKLEFLELREKIVKLEFLELCEKILLITPPNRNTK